MLVTLEIEGSKRRMGSNIGKDTSRAMAKSILVTGASSGLGEALARCFSSSGWQCFGGSRRGVSSAGGSGVRHLVMDVTRPDSVAGAVQSVLESAGRIDAAVCNAGINTSSPAEELGETTARAIVETNFWGVVNTVRAVLPPMRAQRGGTIAVIGSLAGLVAPPGEAFYAASKHALEGWLESLQYEVRGLGIRIYLIEPGFIRTDLASATNPPSGPLYAGYDPLRHALREHWTRAIERGVSSDAAAKRVVRIVERGGSRFRHRIGSDAIWIPRFKRLLPERLFFGIAAGRFGIARFYRGG